MKIRYSVFCVCVLAVFISSCATTQLSQDVDVRLVNLRFDEATVMETTGTFTIRVQNQMPEAMILAGGVHKIYLNGVYIGSGVSDETIEIGRLSEGIQTVRVHLRNLSMARLIRDIIEMKRVDYRLDSRLYVGAGRGRSTLKVSRDGALDLRDFQPEKTSINPANR